MISDTTIAATRTQDVEMKDKFRANFKIALPAVLVTFVLLLIFGRPETLPAVQEYSYNIIKSSAIHLRTGCITARCQCIRSSDWWNPVLRCHRSCNRKLFRTGTCQQCL